MIQINPDKEERSVQNWKPIEGDFETLLSAIPAMIYVRDKKNLLVTANDIFLRTFNLTSSMLPISDTRNFSGNGLESILEGDEEILLHGHPLILKEHRFNLPSGEKTWFWVSKIPYLSSDGELLGMVCTILDINTFKTVQSSLQQKENLFRTLAERSFSAIFIAQNLKLIYINPLFQNCFNLPPDSPLDSISILDLFNTEDAIKLKKKCLAIEKEGLDTSRFLLSTSHSVKGNPLIFEGYLTQIVYQEKPAVLGSLLDITDKYMSSMALEAKAKDFEELNQQLEQRIEMELKKRRQDEDLLLHQSRLAAMGEMIGAIAHQWRQPLTTLSILIQNLWNAYKFSGIDEKTLKHFIEASHLHISRMTENIDQFGRFFATKDIPAPPETMGALLHDSIQIFTGSFPKLPISIDLSPELENEKWTGQTNAFKQVLISLLSMASSTDSDTPVEKQKIILSAEKNKKKIRILLKLPANLNQYQDHSRSGHREITIDMCRKLVSEHMQGKFQIRNNDNNILEFYIELPLK